MHVQTFSRNYIERCLRICVFYSNGQLVEVCNGAEHPFLKKRKTPFHNPSYDTLAVQTAAVSPHSTVWAQHQHRPQLTGLIRAVVSGLMLPKFRLFRRLDRRRLVAGRLSCPHYRIQMESVLPGLSAAP